MTFLVRCYTTITVEAEDIDEAIVKLHETKTITGHEPATSVFMIADLRDIRPDQLDELPQY